MAARLPCVWVPMAAACSIDALAMIACAGNNDLLRHETMAELRETMPHVGPQELPPAWHLIAGGGGTWIIALTMLLRKANAERSPANKKVQPRCQ